MLNFVMVMASTNHMMKCSTQTQPTLTFELELFSMSITGMNMLNSSKWINF